MEGAGATVRITAHCVEGPKVGMPTRADNPDARAHGSFKGATHRAVRRHHALVQTGLGDSPDPAGGREQGLIRFWREFIIDTKNSRAAGAKVRCWAAFSGALLASALLGGCSGPDKRPELALKATSSDVPASVMRGAPATFHTTLTNPSSKTVKQVTISEMIDGASYVSATCTAQGGAVCPDVSTSLWAAVDMPAGSSLTFDVTVLVNPLAQGAIQHHFFADTAANRGSAEVFETIPVVGDVRTGDYLAYWRSGRQTDASFDFMKGAFVTGNGNTYAFTFGADGLLQMEGNARFWTPPDLVVGNAVTDQGLEPFVAARRFVESVAELDGASFNVMGNQLAPDFDMAFSVAYPAWVDGGVLKTCESMQYSAQTCPLASQHHFTLSVSGTEFTGEDDSGSKIHFRVAKSGTSLIFLRVGGNVIQVLEIGIQVNDGPTNASAFGVTSRGVWGWLSLTPASYSVNWTIPGGGTLDETAALSPLAGANPGVMTGQRSSDGARIHLSIGAALGVAIGATEGEANGELQLFAPM